MTINQNYDAMFGNVDSKHIEQVDKVVPEILPLTINHKLIDEVMNRAKTEKKWVLVFVIGTKPCFYKFFGSVKAAEKQGIPHFVINSNQHYDDVLTYGLKEFNLRKHVGANLSLRGDLVQKSSELFFKISWIARFLKKKWPEVTVIPVVLGDTIMTSIVPAAWMFSRYEKAIQIEAGMRSMTAEVMKTVSKNTDPETFIDKQQNGPWMLLRNEPFPEQWDTFVSAAGSEFHFAPLQINKDHLLREGYNEKNIWVTGGVVADALALKKKEKATKSIFELYPQLETDQWIRVDIHRRGNLTPRRFTSIVKGIKELVKKGHNVCFIEMSATRMALSEYKLKDTLLKLTNEKNFLYTKVWPEYAQVLEFLQSDHCFAPLTDSGGVQEEMNILGKPCMTARFNTDRPETVNLAKTNILVPPVDGEFMANMVDHIVTCESFVKNASGKKSIYGENIGEKIMKITKELMNKNEKPFKWSHEELGLWREDEDGLKYL